MKFSSFIVFFLILGIASPTMATLDPRPDRIGIYFDTNGNIGDAIISPHIPFHAFVIIVNPSEPEIIGFEFGYQIQGYGLSELLRFGNELPPGATDTGDNSEVLEGDYVVSLQDPLPATSAVVVVTWQLMLMEDLSAYLSLRAADNPTNTDGFPAYFSESSVISLGYSYWCHGVDGTGATINEACPTAVEASSFGRVKGLYR